MAKAIKWQPHESVGLPQFLRAVDAQLNLTASDCAQLRVRRLQKCRLFKERQLQVCAFQILQVSNEKLMDT